MQTNRNSQFLLIRTTFLLGLGFQRTGGAEMTISKQLALSSVLLSSVWLSPLWAQTSPVPVPGGRPYRQRPCWQQAGISRSVMPKIHEIQQGTRSQVESVCSNSSLTAQQKRQETEQLQQQAQQQIEALVSPAQFQALRSCQEQRGQMAGMHGGGNPCGNVPANTTQQPAPAQP